MEAKVCVCILGKKKVFLFMFQLHSFDEPVVEYHNNLINIFSKYVESLTLYSEIRTSLSSACSEIKVINGLFYEIISEAFNSW